MNTPVQNADSQSGWGINQADLSRGDELLGCLVVLTRMYNKPFSEETLSAGLPLFGNKLTPELFPRAAERAGLTAKMVAKKLADITPLVLPAVLILKRSHACVLKSVSPAGRFEVVDPHTGGTSHVEAAQVELEYDGHVILVREELRLDSRTEHSALPRGKDWFWSVVKQAYPIYGEVLLGSLFVNLFALVMPLFIMNVYDRVVPNDTMETLWALAVGVMIVLLFDFAMRMLRGYLIDIAGKKIDIILSAKLFEKALGIRMEARPASVGSFASNVHEFDPGIYYVSNNYRRRGSAVRIPIHWHHILARRLAWPRAAVCRTTHCCIGASATAPARRHRPAHFPVCGTEAGTADRKLGGSRDHQIFFGGGCASAQMGAARGRAVAPWAEGKASFICHSEHLGDAAADDDGCFDRVWRLPY